MAVEVATHGSKGMRRRSEARYRDLAAQWQACVPSSVNVFPATGWNVQV
jgi:hypothetical protein